MKRVPSYSHLLKERKELIEKITSCGPILRGSLRQQGNICGNPTCRCKDPQNPILHGPYHYLTHRYKDKSQTIFLNEKKKPLARAWVGNYKRLLKWVYRLSEVNYRLLRYYYDEIDPDE